MRPATLLAKDAQGRIVPMDPPGIKWVDGTMRADLPMQRLAQLFNVSHFVVSQARSCAHGARRQRVWCGLCGRGVGCAAVCTPQRRARWRALFAWTLSLPPPATPHPQPLPVPP
eukprot:5041458-Prymnesium_polylepis.1